MSSSKGSQQLSYMIWFIASLLYGLQYVLRALPAVAMGSIKDKFGISDADFGHFAGIYYIGYSIGHIPFSITLARCSSKSNFLAGLVCLLLGIIPNLTSQSLAINIIGRFITGFGSAGILLSGLKILRFSFASGYEKMVGLMVTVGLVVVSVFNIPAASIIQNSGLDWLNLLLIIATLVMMATVIILIPGKEKMKKVFGVSENDDFVPATIAVESNGNKRKRPAVVDDIIQVVCNFRIISVSIIGGLMLGVLEGFADAWVVPFLRGVYGMNDASAVMGGSAIFIGLCVGFPFLGFISEYFRDRLSHMGLLLISALGMLLLMAILMFKICDFSLSFSGLVISGAHTILLLMGILCGYQIAVLSEATNYVSVRLFSLASAFSNMVMMSFGSFFHVAISKVVNSGAVVINGVRNPPSAAALIDGMMVVVICLIIAIAWIICLFVYDKAAKKVRSIS